MSLSSTRRSLYKTASLLGDIQAAQKGGNALGKRLVRKNLYRSNGRVMRQILRSLGL